MASDAKLEVELLPKVTYLPLELSNLIVDYWSGDIIHIMKGGSVGPTHTGYQGHERKRQGRLQ